MTNNYLKIRGAQIREFIFFDDADPRATFRAFHGAQALKADHDAEVGSNKNLHAVISVFKDTGSPLLEEIPIIGEYVEPPKEAVPTFANGHSNGLHKELEGSAS